VPIREPHPHERGAWLRLRERLWPENPPEELAREQERILADPHNLVLVAASEGGDLVGFAEASLRAWAEGCATHPVGYLEAWYVVPEQRRRGLGAKLVRAAERWAREQGCTEMASDADLENQVSHRVHGALGYEEVGRAVLFRKRLAP
jgi:aminoglycoside 6'-N-acetyltransferase I